MKSHEVPIGDAAPDFAFVDGSGAQRSIAGLLGRLVVLLFYRGRWCSSCRRQLFQIGAAYDALQALGAEVVAVSADPSGSPREPDAAQAWRFPLVSDVDLRIIDMYGVRDLDDPEARRLARPAVFVLDRDGRVRFCHVGSHRQDRPATGAILLAVESLTNSGPTSRR